MPQTPPLQGAPCRKCGAIVPEGLHRRLGGACTKCLFALAGENDTLEFPNLEILSKLGEGGMGVVYKALQSRLNRTVALKVLSPDLMDDVRFVERFAREAAALARLTHPFIVAIHDSGVHGGIPYLVMEHVEGTSLRNLLSQGPIGTPRILEIGSALCEALHYAHSRGVIHRDVKPENILIDSDGRVKIADFGLARLTMDGAPRITGIDARLGTPSYMAPEQIEGGTSIDHRADLYALGVVLYEMATRELPIGRFKAPSLLSGVSTAFDAIVLRLLEKDPKARFESATQVQAALDQIRFGGGRRRVRAALIVGAVALALVFAFWKLNHRVVDGWKDLGVTVSDPGPSYRPTLCLDRSGRSIAVWRDDSTGNAEIRLKRWDGAQWTELGGSATGGGISASPGVSREPSIAVDGEGNPVVAWFEVMGAISEVYLKRWNGKTWEELGGSASGGGVSASSGTAVHPCVALDPKGRPLVAWYVVPTSGMRQIYLRRWDGAQWTELGGSATGGGISQSEGQACMPSIAVDAEGNPTVVWHEGNPAEICLRRWDGAAWVELGGSASAGGISRNTGRSATRNPTSVLLDRAGNPIVTWEDETSGNLEIYLRRWDGRVWVELGGSATGGGISCTPAASIAPSMSLDGSDLPVVSWQEMGKGGDRILVRRWTGSAWVDLGGAGPEEGISGTTGNGNDPVVVVDREGAPIVAWSDWSAGAARIRARRWIGK